MNTYGYVGNNPIRYTDPTGTIAGVDDALIIAGLIAGTAAITCYATNCGKPIGDVIQGLWGENQSGEIVEDGPMETAQGNVGDSGIEKDYGEAVSDAKLKCEPVPDKCEWLAENANRYSPERVVRQAKKWGCKGSRHFKGRKKR